jgi:outer membrane protein TolC
VNPTTAFTSDTNWQLGLSFSWPISDGGTADAREARERENRDAVLRDLEDVRLLTEVQVHAAGTRLEVLTQRIAAGRATLSSADAALERIQARESAGAARPLDVLKARAARAGASAALDRDLYERSIALAEWARALGVIDKLIVPETALEPERGDAL